MTDSIKRACAYVPKGGIAKTTSTAHMGVAAAHDHDLDVLLIDLAGTQNDLANQFGLEDAVEDPDVPVSIVFSDKWELLRDSADDLVDRMVYETDEGVDLIPADDGLAAEDNNLANVPREDRYDRLETFITEEIAPEYDLVLFDLPGKEDNITINGLHAAEHVVAPLKPGAFELAQLKNLETELATIAGDDDHDADPQLALVFATMVDQTTNLSSAFVDELEAEHPDIVGEPVAESANISAGQSDGRTLFAFEDDELYNTGTRARKAYRQLTDDLLSRLA